MSLSPFLFSFWGGGEASPHPPFADVEEDENELEENETVLEECYIVAVASSPGPEKGLWTRLIVAVSITVWCFHQVMHRGTRFIHVLYSNSGRGYYSRVATISFSSAGSAATIRERQLIESAVFIMMHSHDN